ncbi:hypothetical protein E4U42_005333 [Claviceps africana]|uniref:Uncharacterized protein n=1 Tax=Claviceps africana TaxID=83212 RepID=A0A8K0J4H6_9HYPO|nr:hypothetical protein E4U42_005333 [Claviceps africana]
MPLQRTHHGTAQASEARQDNHFKALLSTLRLQIHEMIFWSSGKVHSHALTSRVKSVIFLGSSGKQTEEVPSHSG